MECGIIGLPGVGKTSLFSALIGGAAPSSGGGMKPNVGVAQVPDDRLHVIASYITTKKIVPATIQFVDLPGLPTGGGPEGAAKTNAFLSHVRQVDAMCHVVRCFGDDADPATDIETLETELILADLQVADSALDKARRPARAGDREAKERVELLETLVAALGEEKPIRAIAEELSAQQHHLMKSYGMITAKPTLYVANVAEDDLQGESAPAKAVYAWAEQAGGKAVHVCASLEAELAEVDEADRAEMLDSMGLDESAIGPVARAAYALLGLTSFYTAGEKEVRAWTIPAGATAPEAAGAIHSDIQRGFIRAECYHVDELVQYKSEKAIKEAGKLRSEGKHYQLRDGDVVHFLFNV